MDKILFLVTTFPIGVIFIGGLHWFLRVAGFLDVRGWENFPARPQKVMLVSNHPSKNIQPLLTVGLFSHAYITGPLKYGPYSVADKKNFYDRWLFRPIRCRIIPVNRNNPEDDECLRITREVAEQKSNLIWYPEGTRTWKGKKFNYSRKGERMSQFKSGFARIASEFDYIIIPVWCDIRWNKVTFTIGEPLTNLGGQDKKTIVQLTTDALLHLADETRP